MITRKLAQHLRDLHFGGNWTEVDLKSTLADMTWQQALTKVNGFNTIATLVFHCNYYVNRVIPVLQGGPLDATDKDAFTHPPIHSAADWQRLLEKAWAEAEQLAGLIEQLPAEKLDETFVQEKYGTYYRNLQGIIEHTYYHMGQIVLLKKLLATT